MFAVTVAMSIANLALPLHAKALGANYTEIGMLGVTYMVFNVGLSIPVGKAADKYGRKVPLFLGMVSMPVIFLLFAWSNSVAGILEIRLLQGVAEVPIWVVTQTAIADFSSSRERGKAMGKFGSSWAFGFAVGPVLGGILYSSVGAEGTFLLSAFIAVFGAVLAGLTHFPKPNISTERMNLKRIWKPALLGFIFVGVIGVVITLFPPYGRGLGISSAMIGGLITVFSLTRAIFFVPFGHLTDKIGKRKVIMGGLGGISVAFIALGSVTGLLPLALSLVFLAVSGSAIYPAITTLVSEIGAKAGRGYAFGIYNAAAMAGWGVMPGIGGKVADFVGPSAPYLMSGVIILAIIPIIWIVLEK